jgi:hypothetical protein
LHTYGVVWANSPQMSDDDASRKMPHSGKPAEMIVDRGASGQRTGGFNAAAEIVGK